MSEKEHKLKKSWRKTLAGLLLSFMVMLLGFLIWTNISYNRQTVETIRQQNTHTVALWVGSAETRLDMLYEHLYELLLTIYNNADLRKGSPVMQREAQRKCLDVMSDKLRISEDGECFYLADTEGEIRLFTVGSRVPDPDKVRLKEFFYTTDFEVPVGLSDKFWQIQEIDGKIYFVKIVALGKYLVGTASSLSRYDILANYTVLGSEPACYLEVGSNLYQLSGQPGKYMIEADAGNDKTVARDVIMAHTNLKKCDAQVMLVAQQDVFWAGNEGAAMLCGASVLCALFFFYLLLMMQRMIVQPTNTMLKANKQLSGGNGEYRIVEEARNQEFAELFGSFNEMVDNLEKMRVEAYERQLREKRDELKMLRAQIRPHFYLNAITTVSNMTYQNRNEDIRKYLGELVTYVRYMLDTQSGWVRVTDEIKQIKSYLEMQKIRFPGSVDAYIGCAETVEDARIPYLLLFTAVENSFKHAMSLYKPLWLVIQCERYQDGDFYGLRMIVEDNGNGFPQTVIDMFSKQTGNDIPSAKDHLGLTNIRRTLQLTYHRSDLLRLFNAKTGGAHLEIWIPEEKNEATDL